MLNFVADTAVEGLFIASIQAPNMTELEQARRIRLSRKASANTAFSMSEPMAIQILLKLVSDTTFHRPPQISH